MIPIISSPVQKSDISAALELLKNRGVKSRFNESLEALFKSESVKLANSGIAAFYILLEAIKKDSARNEVVLPAYTAGSLVVAVKKAGLRPVLCDISLDDFNADVSSMLNTVSKNTLAVVCVHMFGIGMSGIIGLKENIPGETLLIEDCAQAMGSCVKDIPVGGFSGASFFSFNRGKNLPLCGGGAIATNNHGLGREIKDQDKQITLTGKAGNNQGALLKTRVFRLLSDPFIYGLAFPFGRLFKETKPAKDFAVTEINDFEAALGVTLLRKADEFFNARHKNGLFLANALKDAQGIMIPSITQGSRTAFNRFPLVFKEMPALERAEKELARIGIESSRMYLKPLHKMFELGYQNYDFPNASYLADRLLTLPTHTNLEVHDLERMAESIRKSIQ